MANNALQWETPVEEGAILSTELNSLANGSRSNAGSVFNNTVSSGNNAKKARFRATVDFVSAPSAGAYLAIYKVEALVGSTYADGSSTVDPGAHTWLCNIPLRADTAAQIVDSPEVEIWPLNQKFICGNFSGQAFPASGSTIELVTAREEME